MKPSAARGRLRSLAELQSIRLTHPSAARAQADRPAAQTHAERPAAQEHAGKPPAQARGEAAAEFRDAVRDVVPLVKRPRVPAAPTAAPPDPLQSQRDDQAALGESLAEIDVESLLETDESLSYRREGISADTLRKLRRGFWMVQGELDLHGHRVEEARYALGEFLRNAMHRGRRCVRIVHGKGLGSRDGVPILKGKVRTWLIRRDEVIAFCQARAPEGGSGAVIVLLKPSSGSG
jgi:DNA-nicking Smr family endonuclease